MILADARWEGTHGIGRYTHEVLSRLKNTERLYTGPAPLSLQNLFWLPYQLHKLKQRYRVYYNPGFNPVLLSPIPFVLTIHDLIHLDFPGKFGAFKKLYYEKLTKPSVKQAFKIITVSEYSKKSILEWANIPENNIVVVGSGISPYFSKEGARYQPGYPYLLHTGNTKAHKNTVRMIEAFATAKIDTALRLILTGTPTQEHNSLIAKYKLDNRVIFSGPLSNEKLAEYYRGAHAFLFPSLLEGFGLPVIEAMTSGIPTLTSNITSLPEVAGDAAILVDPYQIESIAEGIEKITTDTDLRNNLVSKGFERVKLFSWNKTADKVQQVLNSAP